MKHVPFKATAWGLFESSIGQNNFNGLSRYPDNAIDQ